MEPNVKSRKKTRSDQNDNLDSQPKPKPTKNLVSLEPSTSKNIFCLLGSLFGLPSRDTNHTSPPNHNKTSKSPPSTPNSSKKSRKKARSDQNDNLDSQSKPSTFNLPPNQKETTQSPELSPNSATKENQEDQNLVCERDTKRKSVVVAYILWLFGGVFGLHLFYLERDAHAFLTWSTLGGYGLGWLADVTKIPRYVRSCNNDDEFLRDLWERIRRNRKPPFSTSRFVSAIMVGYLWGQLVMLAIPEDEVAGINWNTYLHWFIPLAMALGVWVVGNIGRECGSPWLTIFASYLSYLSRWYFFDENIWTSIVIFSAALTFDHFSKEWQRSPRKKRSFIRRSSTLLVCGILYIGLWSSYIYFNGKITDSNGDEIPIHEALHHFFTSPWWTDLKQSLYDTYQYAQHHGWYEVWKQIIDLSDPHGEQNAYKVLNVSPTASQSEITTRWRSLSREFHPDKVKDPEKQREAQERFMEIQQAYEILSNIKNKRRRKNKKSVFDE